MKHPNHVTFGNSVRTSSKVTFLVPSELWLQNRAVIKRELLVYEILRFKTIECYFSFFKKMFFIVLNMIGFHYSQEIKWYCLPYFMLISKIWRYTMKIQITKYVWNLMCHWSRAKSCYYEIEWWYKRINVAKNPMRFLFSTSETLQHESMNKMVNQLIFCISFYLCQIEFLFVLAFWKTNMYIH